MGRYNHHKYTWTKPFGDAYHRWELVGPDGGLHFRASYYSNGGWSCGLEIHFAEKQGDRAPDHLDCPVTGSRCWHDGTSLYATETLWPRIEGYLRSGEHERVFSILEREADERFGYLIDAEVA